MSSTTKPAPAGAGKANPQVASGPAGRPPLAEQQDDALDLRAVLLPFWRRKWIILLTTILAVLVAVFVATNMERQYTASARVIFEPERLRIIDLDNVVVRPEGNVTGLQNQIEILRSAVLLERVIETLRLESTPEFNPALRAEPAGLLDRALSRLPLPERVTAHLVDFGIIAPPPVRDQAPEERAEQLRGSTLSTLIRTLRLRPIPNSRVIEINYTATNSGLATAIVNAIAEQYIIVQAEQKREEVARATELLSVRVRDLENRYNSAEQALRAAEIELSMGSQFGSSLIARQLEELGATLAEARQARAAIESRHARAAQALDGAEDYQLVPDFRNSPAIQSYRAREIELLDQEVSLRAIVASETNPTIIRLQARLDEVRRNREEEAATIVASLAADLEAAHEYEASLEAALANLENRAVEQTQAEMRLGRLQRDAQSIRVVYETFLNRLQETSEQASLQSPDARFLTRATRPQVPDATAGQRLVMMAALGGIAIGMALAFLLERLNDTFRSSREVQARTGYPVLAGIPKVGRRTEPRHLLSHLLEKPEGSLAESIRNLRTSILFSNIDQAPKVIMFTSSLPGEGKTTTAILAGITSQQMERSTISVDCDLRRRALGVVFPRSTEQPGLFAALQGRCAIEEAVYVEPETGLHVLSAEPAARTPGNSADIIASRKFERLVRQLKARYDLVVLDTPPTLVVTDSRLVAQLADTVVYVVRWDHTRPGAVVEGLGELASVEANVAGVAFTMVGPKKASKYISDEYFYKRSYGGYRGA
jgi:polysaccharide biosynthesis transport protein